MEQIDKSTFEHALGELLQFFGENIEREGLKETPARVTRMYQELLGGYQQGDSEIYKVFKSNGYHDLVTVSNIDFYSLCEHHIIPFFGKVHIGYLPNGKVLGLSKFARLVDIFSKRLQTQENLTQQIADSIEKYLKPNGLIILIEAQHLCVSMRGIKKKGFITTTTTIRGKLKRNTQATDQFYRNITNYSLKIK